ncbi:MAG: helix-turn-helix domain-containing protein [Hyphomonadaceae bacterium]
MTWALLLAVVLPLASSANALVLAGALAQRSAVLKQSTGFYGAALLAVGAMAMIVITLDHSGLLSNAAASALIEGSLTLASGPLLVLFVRRMLGLQGASVILFAPLALFLALGAIAPGLTLDHFKAERLVLVQMGYTLGAAVIVVRSRPSGRRAKDARRIAIAVVCALGAIHLAQLVRMAWPQADVLRNIVPLSAALCFTIGAALIYSGARTLDVVVEGRPVRTPKMDELADAFDALLDSGGLRDPGLTAAGAAVDLGVATARLGEALEATRGMNLTAYLQRRRVEEAQRLMADPAEARTSMEAIGLLAGFGSRSAFYAAFREQVGMTPAAWRTNKAGKPCPDSDSGQV